MTLSLENFFKISKNLTILMKAITFTCIDLTEISIAKEISPKKYPG